MTRLLYFYILLACVSCKKEPETKVQLSQAVVQDYALLFSQVERDSLSNKIIDYENLTTNEICIYTLDSLSKGTNIKVYATHLANRLGVGKKEKNNGLFILLSKKNKHVSIATGYGTKKILTDSICKTIIDNTMITNFIDDEYYCGISSALDSIISKR